jgi:hypothetical protein
MPTASICETGAANLALGDVERALAPLKIR